MRGKHALFGVLSSALLAVCTVSVQSAASTADGSAARHGNGKHRVDYHQWTHFRSGHSDGARTSPRGLTIGKPAGTVTHTEPELHTTRDYDVAHWTSRRYTPGVKASEIVASWNARTPKDTWIDVRMRATTTGGRTSGWYTMGRWAFGDRDILRTSVDNQSDDVGSVSVDTFQAADKVRVSGYQLRVNLYRATGTRATPTVSMAGAMASAVPDRYTVPASKPGVARGIELPVPRYAQNLHKGQLPQYGGGGEAWCSPTSTEMVTEYWGRGPSKKDLSWVDPSWQDPSVDYAARYTYDHAYDGTGNWPFNTAYAAHHGLSGHVTRLDSLNEAERYIRRGIPVITSQSFAEKELDGAGYGTAGHLMVIVGFTRSGDVIANDPATDADKTVRNVYKRRQFENIWLRTKRIDEDGKQASGSGGIAYIVTPKGMPTPGNG